MKHIAISIEYAGLTLPLIKFADGHTRIPLKPLCVAAGVSYEGQYAKLRGDRLKGSRKNDRWTHLARAVGMATGHAVWGGQRRELVMIRADRVLAFFSAINPVKLRSCGNVDSAAFIEEQRELLFALEAAGIHQGGVAKNQCRRMDSRSPSAVQYRQIARALLICAIDAIDDPVIQAYALAEIGIQRGGTADLFD